MVNADIRVAGQNKLIALLPAEVQKRIEPTLETLALEAKYVVYEPDGLIDFVYFPLSAVVSLVVTMRDGATIEVGAIGNEGMVGMPVFLGLEHSPTKTLVQVPGQSARMPADELRKELASADGILRDVLARYGQAMINQVSQSVACNHIHTVEERLCRWLLMAHDRVRTNDFSLTHEFLAQMLGVRRPSVTIAAGVLEKAGLITYKRGRITVVDRPRLEAASCECYGVVKRGYDTLLGSSAVSA